MGHSSGASPLRRTRERVQTPSLLDAAQHVLAARDSSDADHNERAKHAGVSDATIKRVRALHVTLSAADTTQGERIGARSGASTSEETAELADDLFREVAHLTAERAQSHVQTIVPVVELLAESLGDDPSAYELGGAAYIVGHDGQTRGALYAIDGGLVVRSISGAFSVTPEARSALRVRDADVLCACDASMESQHVPGLLEGLLR